ncbi:MAG: hypothetical protein KatS3mg111_2185 [Pirellulaceae bacterium]|nr:MAG: hypothetical protein KatS3mg111_2185 [Pirellulaceae bacterium]
MRRRTQWGHWAWIGSLLAGLMTTTPGCVGLLANVLHAVYGNNIPAKYEGLEGKRVALLCRTDAGFSGDATSSILSSSIHAALSMNVKDIDMVRQSEIEQWLDAHSWDDSDYVEIGKGVQADRLVVVEVSNLQLKNGQTLYQGRANVTVTVYEIPSGKLVFREQMPEFVFPSTGGMPVTETTETKFRSFFLQVITRRVAGLFYPVDATSDVALDATASGI